MVQSLVWKQVSLEFPMKSWRRLRFSQHLRDGIQESGGRVGESSEAELVLTWIKILGKVGVDQPCVVQLFVQWHWTVVRPKLHQTVSLWKTHNTLNPSLPQSTWQTKHVSNWTVTPWDTFQSEQFFSAKVPVGSHSYGGDVAVYVLDINQLSLPLLFILFWCLFLCLWPFQLYLIPQILPTTLRFLTLFFQSYFCRIGSFNYIYTSHYDSLLQLSPWVHLHELGMLWFTFFT